MMRKNELHHIFLISSCDWKHRNDTGTADAKCEKSEFGLKEREKDIKKVD